MGINNFSLTQGSYFLSEEIHEARLSLIMIIGQNQKQHLDGNIADFRMVLVVDQTVTKYLHLYFGY